MNELFELAERLEMVAGDKTPEGELEICRISTRLTELARGGRYVLIVTSKGCDSVPCFVSESRELAVRELNRRGDSDTPVSEQPYPSLDFAEQGTETLTPCPLFVGSRSSGMLRWDLWEM